MTVEGIRKATKHFLETMNNEGIYEINSEFFEEYIASNDQEIQKLFSYIFIIVME